MLPHYEAQAKKRQLSTLKQNAAVTAKMPEREDKGEARQQVAKKLEVGERYVSDLKKLKEEDQETFEVILAISIINGRLSPELVVMRQFQAMVSRKQGWNIIDHCCKICFGRLLERIDEQGVKIVRCADCGIHVKGSHRNLCCCGVRAPNRRYLYGYKCVRQKPTPELPAEIICIFEGNI